MELTIWLLYVSVISILILSPGPSALLCMSDGVKVGSRKAIPTVLGGAIAAMLLMTISAIGLGAILVASETLFLIVKLLGACYLIYLGWSTWKEGGIKLDGVANGNGMRADYSFYAMFRKGFMVGISNPKDLLFFIALFPSFMNAELPQLEQFIVLACTWFVVDCASMFIYAGLGSNISPWLSKASNMRLLNRTVGSVFVVLGGMLALSSDVNAKG